MRGEIRHVQDVGQAMAVLDLALGGVKVEMAAQRFDWLAAPEPKTALPPVVSEGKAPEALPVVLPQKAEAKAAAPAKVPEAAGAVWESGEAGGVLLVMQGDRPDGGMVVLAEAMLRAVGLQEAAISWVGYTGGLKTDALLTAMKAKAPQQVLLLGQAPLGVLMNRNLGVEGWHAAGGGRIEGWDGVPVGVTYPLELLMKQPLFKRLAWQHLLAWGETRIQP